MLCSFNFRSNQTYEQRGRVTVWKAIKIGAIGTVDTNKSILASVLAKGNCR